MFNKLEPHVQKNLHKYHVHGCTSIKTVSINEIKLRVQNTLSHEMMKFLIGYLIRKYGTVEITNDMINCIKTLEKYVETQNKSIKSEGHSFIMEAERNINNEEARVVVDVVDIHTCDEYEVETDEKRAKELMNDEKTRCVKVIKMC